MVEGDLQLDLELNFEGQLRFLNEAIYFLYIFYENNKKLEFTIVSFLVELLMLNDFQNQRGIQAKIAQTC